MLETTNHELAGHGIDVGKVKLDVGKMLARKDEIVSTLTGGINMLLKRNKVTTLVGRGKFTGPKTIEVTGRDSGSVTADKIIIATGSIPTIFPGIEFDGDLIGDSTTALSYPKPPAELIVIGAGYIGLELGSVWRRMGSKVTVLEAMDRILPGLDNEFAKLAHRVFEKQGIQFLTGMFVESAKVEKGRCVVKCKGQEPIAADRVLVCTGRTPNTKNIGLESIGVAPDKRGTIVVDKNFQTSAAGVFAIGDCIGGAMLAHKASEEGIACVEKIVTGYGHVNYEVIPAIVYTNPEIASVGKTEEQLKEAGIKFKKGMCPYGAQRSGENAWRYNRPRQNPCRRRDRPDPRRPRYRLARRRLDLRSGSRDEFPRQRRRPRPLLSRPPDPVRDHDGSRPCRRRPRDPYVRL